MPTHEQLAAALDRVTDPVSGRGLIASGRAAPPRGERTVDVVLDVSGLDDPARARLEADVRVTLGALPGVEGVRVAMTAQRAAAPRLIAVASGKGGVGKSTVAASLAVALAKRGIKVGMVDADIYGPSQPRLLDADRKPEAESNKLIPVDTRHGVPTLSMGQLVAPGQAIAWRGPMAGNALTQLVDAHWGDTQALIVDMPPGTGDVQLSMIQKHRPAGAVIVSTPQDLALIDATRAIDLFNKANVPIIGLVENMAGYACPKCGEISEPFGRGGAEAEAARLGMPFLGRIPLAIEIRTASDAGQPDIAPFAAVADGVANWLNR
ncbi:Mrp/NBP35 family ATP-binding protein [uncultured Sphingomonas sp.]|uniref:Mrp/NBP35 family ATP-binding protein n=1 Tax=uncultured Sphingomonas sp. TaxID=158754 RepID=UPI0025EC3393|nr:Mrp/NBP35 family ATP-binding protein [uncultured Sphingomonas sp.]